MTIKTLYRYNRPDGGVSISPIKPEVEYTELYRIIAEQNKALTQDYVSFYFCKDVTDYSNWFEIDYDQENNKPILSQDIIDKSKAYDILMGASE